MAIDSFWDRSYRDGSFREHWDPPEVPAELIELAKSGALPDGATVLDVGCGAGLELVFLAARGFTAIGVDESREAFAWAQERAAAAEVELDLREGSVLDLPVATGTIDLILDRGCLHLFEREDRPDYAAEIARVLGPGGRLLLRGAAEDDEEQGLVGFDAAEIDQLFPAPAFTRGPVEPVTIDSRAGGLEGRMVLVEKR